MVSPITIQSIIDKRQWYNDEVENSKKTICRKNQYEETVHQQLVLKHRYTLLGLISQVWQKEGVVVELHCQASNLKKKVYNLIGLIFN